jgi:hypothetical protein
MSELPTKALTLYQPYAWLVARGYKPIENRKESFTQKTFRGPFWVHAGIEECEEVWRQARELCDQYLGKDFKLPTFAELPFGQILGRATIIGVHYPRSTLFPPKDPVPWHFPDEYGLILSDAVALASPVLCRGMQGFWPVPADVLQTLREASCA